MNIKESFKILRRKFEHKNILFVSGNVYDSFQTYVDGKPQRELESLVDRIKIYAEKSEYKAVNYFRPEMGYKNLMSEDEPIIMPINEYLNMVSNDIENETKDNSKVYIIDLADIYFSNKNEESRINEISRIISAVVIKSKKTSILVTDLKNNSKVIFVMRDSGNVVSDISSNNNEYGSVVITKPDSHERSDFIEIFARTFGTTDAGDLKSKNSKVHKEAVILTSGMGYKEILQLARISDEDNTFKSLLNISKFHKTKSEWEKLNYDDIKNMKKIFSNDIKGQDFAIENVERVLKNSFLGLSGVLNGANNHKPKGILFFSGPTGVGKTEMAKTITKFVFGEVSRMIRFDMSEFSQEHSDQRLIGSPPGYVGYDGGGELTNAIKNEPQSIIYLMK